MQSKASEEQTEETPNKRYVDEFNERTHQIRTNFTLESYNYLKLSIYKRFFCFAKHSTEQQYFRAEIIDAYENQEQNLVMKVFFVDYGDYDTVYLDEIYPMLEHFLKMLPFQAIQCAMDNIRPFFTPAASQTPQRLSESSLTSNGSAVETQEVAKNQPSWSLEAGDTLWSLTHDKKNQYISLWAQVVSETTPTEAQQTVRSYIIQLRRACVPEDLDISHLMVATRQARFSLSTLTEWFGINLKDVDLNNNDESNSNLSGIKFTSLNLGDENEMEDQCGNRLAEDARQFILVCFRYDIYPF
jgi:hypothetical protein